MRHKKPLGSRYQHMRLGLKDLLFRQGSAVVGCVALLLVVVGNPCFPWPVVVSKTAGNMYKRKARRFCCSLPDWRWATYLLRSASFP